MPRISGGMYVSPVGTYGIPNTTVASAPYNANIDDVALDLNTARPIVAGGTGATNAPAALANLGAIAAAGGTMSGNLVIAYADPVIQLQKTLASSGHNNAIQGYNGTLARWAVVLGDSAAESTGNVGSNFDIFRYSDAGALLDSPFSIARADGNITIANGLRVNSPGTLPAISAGNAVRTWFAADHAQAAYYFGETGTNALSFNGTAYTLAGGPLNVSSTTASSSTGTGALTVGGGLGVAGRIYAGDPITTYFSSATTQGALYLGSTGTKSLAFDGTSFVLSGGRLNATDNVMAYFSSAPAQGALYLGNSGTVSLSYNGTRFDMNGGPFYLGNATAAKPGGGPFIDSSDSRIKTVIGPYEHGLAEVVQLEPVHYVFKGNDGIDHKSVADEQRAFIGLIAQAVETVMPEMVTKINGVIDGQPVTDLRLLDTGPLIFALVNACKQLAARVEALEASR